MTDTDLDPREAERARRLHNDDVLRASVPDPQVHEAARRPGMRLAQTVATLLDGYAERAALGERAQEAVHDPETGRTALRLRPGFVTTTYGELAQRVRAVTADWHATGAVRPGDAVGILGFTSGGYAALELACFERGAVVLPLQASASVAQLSPIVEEASARLLVASVEQLDRAVDAVRENAGVEGLLVLDHDGQVDDHREALDGARRRLADAGHSASVEPLADVVTRGRELPAAPLYTAEEGDDPLAMLIYTSGSTGTPKGAMYPESLVRTLWDGLWFSSGELPVIGFNYMPMSHLAGQVSLIGSLAAGGIGYFTANSDLSTLFEDLAAAAPTELTLVPRVCDMLHQRYQSELDRRGVSSVDPDADAAVKSWVHDELLGGRLLRAMCSTAPLSDELANFVEDCIGLPLHIGYGSTEDGIVTIDRRVQRPPVLDYALEDVPDLGYFSTDSPHPRGELLVRTSTRVPGYYRRDDATAEVFDDDGFYHTGDVFAEIEPDHLVYVDRRTNVLKLAQGEFVAVSNLESIYVESPLVRQIFVYGNSARSYLLAVVVPTGSGDSADGDGRLRAQIVESLREVATEHGLNSYEIPRDVVVETQPFSTENGLLSDARKLLRPRLIETYGERLESLYADLAGAQDDELRDLRRHGAERDTLETVTRAALAMLEMTSDTELDPATRFVDLGGDSLSALSFAQLLGQIFDVEVAVGNVIGATSDLAHLARQIDAQRGAGTRRPTASAVHGADVSEVRAADLTLEAFLDADTISGAASLPGPAAEAHTVLVTGATGYLGRFLALDWLERLAPVGGRVVCLVRAPDAEAARARLDATFDSGDPTLSAHYRELAATSLEVLPGDIGDPSLGLDAGTWERLASDVDRIIHPAALVNHVLPYDQLFGPNVVGTAELIRLALTTRTTPITYLSTVAVPAVDTDDLDEDADIRTVSPVRTLDEGYANGYATSKWAGEVLLRETYERCALPVTVLRSDLIMTHTRWSGQLNVPDMFTRLLLSIAATGIAPTSFYSPDGSRPRAHYDGLPVDFTAEAVDTIGGESTEGFATFNVLNPHADGVSLDTIVDWLAEAGPAITRIDDYASWYSRFTTALRALPETQRRHSMEPLLTSVQWPDTPVDGSALPADRFRAAVREAKIGPDGDIPHVTADLVAKYVADLRALGLFPSTQAAWGLSN